MYTSNLYVITKVNVIIDKYKQRVDEMIKEQEGLLKEFNSKIFNALVVRIEILEPTHFVL